MKPTFKQYWNSLEPEQQDSIRISFEKHHNTEDFETYALSNCTRKFSYDGLKTGQIVTLNESSIHEGYLLDAGTEIEIKYFAEKSIKADRYNQYDVNKKGNKRKFMISGVTVKPIDSYLLKTVISRPIKVLVNIADVNIISK